MLKHNQTSSPYPHCCKKKANARATYKQPWTRQTEQTRCNLSTVELKQMFFQPTWHVCGSILETNPCIYKPRQGPQKQCQGLRNTSLLRVLKPPRIDFASKRFGSSPFWHWCIRMQILFYLSWWDQQRHCLLVRSPNPSSNWRESAKSLALPFQSTEKDPQSKLSLHMPR